MKTALITVVLAVLLGGSSVLAHHKPGHQNIYPRIEAMPIDCGSLYDILINFQRMDPPERAIWLLENGYDWNDYDRWIYYYEVVCREV